MISRSNAKAADEPLAEINITPLVDVMLVLVVILLVMAPMLTRTLHIDLPKVAAGAPEPRDHAVTVSLDAHGKLAIDDREIAPDQLEPTLRRIATLSDRTVVNLRSDQSQSFGAVANLLAKISHAGIAHVAVVTANAEPRN
ncbi:Biopolymer transport protein ExbD [Paraburkholderia domus]|jgi:Biopolymer transport protein|uniref:Biopolymer transport protein ExbD n=1 Tax=Paraburkholderia domus TaxID=2793075 RepID=A0A9N8N347_9BURK|nr:biopolymer transporter ExbD [Paraburkholderia domus]MBK5052145.1 biopolymer transporter ExbD [Burkholderia sp. R-70006]MBK5064300.1 biopolymer transporter ExbD [Burkholderia sp. R-70199]MBK5089233.1 biopolymer transporter ExbD [Burkholderia sp. R-69927]MBK5122706.1 biopolymer transporter ExbD [Burkholderia sp. R-69980]MBK5168274.1 biopolymer transporter ExbD [Burkholderia sp. R-70211]MBK5183553.1 biopolymer transporter ExbD [Burkholderia sp. R-69749]MCI0149635.1 biopolymer transporter Exb